MISRKILLIHIALFTGAVVAFMMMLFWFLQSQGLSRESFYIAMVIFVPAIVAVGYLLLDDILNDKLKQDKRLEHITREVLHEIKLPISTIETNIGMIMPHLADDRNIKRAQRILDAASRLQREYDNLAYNIKREISQIELEMVDVSDIVLERVAIHQEMGRNRLDVEVESTLMILDRIGLEQVLDNILQNSMKYSSPDRPIQVTLHDGKLTITDHGVGMDATQIAHIYERYYQGERDYEGEGIGLALVKRYCDEYNISIQITSTVGVGTSVSLDFGLLTPK